VSLTDADRCLVELTGPAFAQAALECDGDARVLRSTRSPRTQGSLFFVIEPVLATFRKRPPPNPQATPARVRRIRRDLARSALTPGRPLAMNTGCTALPSPGSRAQRRILPTGPWTGRNLGGDDRHLFGPGGELLAASRVSAPSPESERNPDRTQQHSRSLKPHIPRRSDSHRVVAHRGVHTSVHCCRGTPDSGSASATPDILGGHALPRRFSTSQPPLPGL